MNILITSPRAPVTLEWVLTARNGGHRVTLADSLHFPIVRFCRDDTVTYRRIPAPRLDFSGYAAAMRRLVSEADLVIPTCEDIFYLARLPLTDTERQKCFMPSEELLFALHHKAEVFRRMPSETAVCFPETRLLIRHDQIISDGTSGKKTVLKPVFSRFGRSVIRGVTTEKVRGLSVSPSYPWVQQAFVTGEGLCNYAVCAHGEVIAHTAYRPRYLLNNAAATYFDPVQDSRLDEFVSAFATKHRYHGQVAFDFIDDGSRLWLLECNPRATSGLHLLRGCLNIGLDGVVAFSGNPATKRPYRIGASLPLLFGFQALKNGTWQQLVQDYRAAEDAVSRLPAYGIWLAFGEMLYRAVRHRRPLTSASTFDIEYDGES